jgi:hypothetical protein
MALETNASRTDRGPWLEPRPRDRGRLAFTVGGERKTRSSCLTIGPRSDARRDVVQQPAIASAQTRETDHIVKDQAPHYHSLVIVPGSQAVRR